MLEQDNDSNAKFEELKRNVEFLIDLVQKIKTPENKKFERYLTSKQVAEIYNLSKAHISDLRAEGKLPYTSVFDVILHPQSQIDEVLTKTIRGGIDNRKK